MKLRSGIRPIRAVALIALPILLACALLLGLYSLQVVNREAYRELGRNTVTRVETVPGARGDILDRYGRVLVTNVVSYDIQIERSALVTDADPNGILLALIDMTEKAGIRHTDTLPITSDTPFEFTEMDDIQAGRMADWLAHYRSLLIARFVRDPEEILNMAEENIARLKEQSAGMELADITAGITTIARTMNDARYSPQPRTLLELAVVTLAAGLEEGQPQVARTVRQVRKINEPAAAGKATAAQAASPVRAASAPDPGNVPPQAPEKAPGKMAAAPRTPAGAPADEREATAETEKTAADVAGEPVPAEAATESAPAAPVAEQPDPDEVWDRMWDALGDENGSLFLVRMNAVPAGINATSFRIACGTDLSKEIAEKNRNKLTEALAQATGKNLKLIITGSDAAENAEADAADDAEAEAQAAARKIEEVFSIKPRIVN